MLTSCSSKLKGNKDPSWFGRPVIASSLCLCFIYSSYAFQVCLILPFCTQSHTLLFLFAKGYKGTVKYVHTALSKKSIVSLKHCQKTILPLQYLGIIGPHSEWSESLPINGRVFQEAALVSASLQGWSDRGFSATASLSVYFSVGP